MIDIKVKGGDGVSRKISPVRKGRSIRMATKSRNSYSMSSIFILSTLVAFGADGAVHSSAFIPPKKEQITWLQCEGSATVRTSTQYRDDDGSLHVNPETTRPWNNGHPVKFVLIMDTEAHKAGWYDGRRHALRWIDDNLDDSAPDFVKDDQANDTRAKVKVRYNRSHFTDTQVQFVCELAERCSDIGLQGGHRAADFSLDRKTLDFKDVDYVQTGPRSDGFFGLVDIRTQGKCSKSVPLRVDETAI